MAKLIEPSDTIATQAATSETEATLDLRQMTDARVSLGRHGAGLPTKAQLSFLLDHARAREAVWTSIDRASLTQRLDATGFSAISVDSMAGDRSTYVRRPDLGRLLDQPSAESLSALAAGKSYDIAIVVADGLSSSAVDLNAVPLIEALVPKLSALKLETAPIVLASQARVALGDPVGEALRAKLSILLVGERPGLSAADSLGAYITYGPRPGKPDSGRNCISNIRDGGLKIAEAAEIIANLVRDMVRTQVSGVALKAAMAKLGAG